MNNFFYLSHLLIFITILYSCFSKKNEANAQIIEQDNLNCVFNLDTVFNRELYYKVDKMPEFSLGNDKLLSFFMKNFEYPKNESIFQGSINLTFVIESNGKVKDVKVINNPLTTVDKEAIRVLKLMPDWNPGKCNGKNVPVRIRFPVKF